MEYLSPDGNKMTDSDKLKIIKRIIEDNLYSIFTAIVLNLNNNQNMKQLSDYSTLKDILGIQTGVGREEARVYDENKMRNPIAFREIDDKAFKNLIKWSKNTRNCDSADRYRHALFCLAYRLVYDSPLSKPNVSIDDIINFITNLDNFDFHYE